MLHNAFSELQTQWREIENLVVDSKNIWDMSDPTRIEFDRRYWNDIPNAMYDYLDSLRELADIIQYTVENLPCR